ncbi:unnamed protein product [Coccothraustes coccothraustes]
MSLFFTSFVASPEFAGPTEIVDEQVDFCSQVCQLTSDRLWRGGACLQFHAGVMLGLTSNIVVLRIQTHKILHLKRSSLIGPSKQSGYPMGAKVLQRVLQEHCVSLMSISSPVLTATQ